MQRIPQRVILTVLMVLLLPALASAQEISGRDLERAANGVLERDEEVVKTPEEQAIDHYNQGIALIQRADGLLEKAGTLEGAKREKMLNKAGKSLVGAAREFESASLKNPTFPEAFALMGYSLSRVNDFEGAVEAFDGAIALQPADLRSIAGRAQALLSLGRLDEAKQAYNDLASINREQAQGLLSVMEAWVAGRDTEPEAVELASWIAQVRTAG